MEKLSWRTRLFQTVASRNWKWSGEVRSWNVLTTGYIKCTAPFVAGRAGEL